MDDFKFLQHLENKKQNSLLLDTNYTKRLNLNKIFTLLLLFIGYTESHRAISSQQKNCIKEKRLFFLQAV